MKSFLTTGVAVVLVSLVSTPAIGQGKGNGIDKGVGIAKRIQRQLDDIERSSKSKGESSASRDGSDPARAPAQDGNMAGLEAFWPRAYDENTVLELIDDSDLDEHLKSDLEAELLAARTDRDLRLALSDIRKALGIE